MAAVMSHSLNVECSHDDALKHKPKLRPTTMKHSKHRPRPAAMARTAHYSSVGQLDDLKRDFAY
eukprot:7990689-Pyramimonas_sp.AAC.1